MKTPNAIFAVGATGAAGRDFATTQHGPWLSRRYFTRVRLWIVLLIVITGSQTVQAQVKEGTLWREAVISELDVDFGDTGFHGRWRFHRCDCGDLQVQFEQIAPDVVVNGELLMVGGQVLLARGFEQPEPDIEPLIQAPSLMLQLAFQMLSSVQPQGPYALKEKQVWEQSEPNLDFKISTGLATGIFAAPWNIKGSGWKTDAGHYRFELFLQFSIAMPGESEAKSSITLSGDLEYQQHDFPYDGSTDLGGWSIQWIAVNDLESEPAPAGLTLDALRQQVRDL
jgi:hypothetical protein